MDPLLWAAVAVALWSTSLVAVLAVLSAARRSDDAMDRDLAEAVRVRDLGLPALPPLTSRSIERESATAHPGPGLA
ncbi:MAG: hypothetical protein QOJ22_796 [Thermoleophilaceae bacterium]|jgi:hypothetical protein|nr:hypothetical protein [Thermoleophilaceae bacterium]